MPEDYFSDTLIGAITDSMVLQTLVSRKLPTILKQVRKLDASLSAPCLQWFVCLFITVLPIHITIRIWDLVLVHGSHTLFWVALAMLHLSQKRILEAKNEGELFAIMTTIAEELDDERVLMKAVAKFKIPKSTIVSLQEIERKALDHRMREVKSSDKNKSIRDAKNAESTRPTLQNNSKSNVSADDSNSYDPSATEDADISDADSTSYHAGEVEPGFEDVEEVDI
uniref:Rab-GAP TBC domain-containing protein n=1 Tax=Amorphochlora amoebiformis TaxID=1561963 RepID=A0A7S0H0D9_9EUKA